jgi:hypothetical protein
MYLLYSYLLLENSQTSSEYAKALMSKIDECNEIEGKYLLLLDNYEELKAQVDVKKGKNLMSRLSLPFNKDKSSNSIENSNYNESNNEYYNDNNDNQIEDGNNELTKSSSSPLDLVSLSY